MSIKLADLPDYHHKYVRVEWDVAAEGGDEASREMSGKVVGVSPTYLIVQDRKNIEMIKLADLLEVEEVIRYTTRDALIIRKIAKVTTESVRQHLLDRHGWNVDYVRSLSDEDALRKHEELDHKMLGHVHGPTEKGRPGRKPKKRLDDGNPVPVQRSEEPDGDSAHVHDS